MLTHEQVTERLKRSKQKADNLAERRNQLTQQLGLVSAELLREQARYGQLAELIQESAKVETFDEDKPAAAAAGD